MVHPKEKRSGTRTGLKMNEKSNKTLKIQKGVTFSDHDHFKKNDERVLQSKI